MFYLAVNLITIITTLEVLESDIVISNLYPEEPDTKELVLEAQH